MFLFNCLPITFLLFPLSTFLLLTPLTFLLFPLLTFVLLTLPAQEQLPTFSFLAVDFLSLPALSLGDAYLLVILSTSLRVFENVKRAGNPLQLFLVTPRRKFPAQTAICPDYIRAAGR